ncbi:MAG: UvrB/UvrC motif-containing protein [Tissierellia bacterium]|nr:UvrB/UvrC motif-containing protein [Tissierellia bacterium]
MICDKCKERESVISYTKIHEDRIEEVHLCEICAEKQLKFDFADNSEVMPQIEELLRNIFQLTSKVVSDTEDITCTFCGCSFKGFQKSGKVGCEHCYDEFKEEIINYLKSINSSPVHRGKTPNNLDEKLLLERKIRSLRDDLELSIQLEDYEEAAKLRDRIKALKDE